MSDHQAKGYEASDVSVRGVAYVLGILFVCLGLTGGLVAGMFALFSQREDHSAASPLEMRVLSPPSPRLEVSPAGDRAAVEARARGRLEGYGWTNRETGRVHIPIEAAMRLTIQQGWQDETGKPQP
ncbi:hypothetical protein [Microvirga puerhi]|uniref:Uncharacterized protein n=1 Tax=Microvirga puerhi TaxID=2876078 RepID=A0ABS7VJJ8_9HYPH|nr:hypothetical protein [Microvirga puerhi]MBZ6075703.1 hypothetical protein [Microvirga puerhi]